MASTNNRPPATPRQAVCRRAILDRTLDAERFKSLGQPTRARLLACLTKCGRPCSVTEIAECCSIDFSMVARHLAALARVGLLSVHKEGRTVWYQADAARLATEIGAIAASIEEWVSTAANRAPLRHPAPPESDPQTDRRESQ